MAPHATSTEPTTASLATETMHPRYPPLDFTIFANTISYPPNHVPSLNSTTHSAPSPCTLEPGPPIPTATKIDVDFAIAAAGTAYEEWGRKTDCEERKLQVRQLLEGLEGEKEGLVRLSIREGGKPVSLTSFGIRNRRKKGGRGRRSREDGKHWIAEGEAGRAHGGEPKHIPGFLSRS